MSVSELAELARTPEGALSTGSGNNWELAPEPAAIVCPRLDR